MSIPTTKPYNGEIEQAKLTPGGWVYRIAGKFAETEDVPPCAIVGAWQVDENGSIIGEFKRNPNYDGTKWPSPVEQPEST